MSLIMVLGFYGPCMYEIVMYGLLVILGSFIPSDKHEKIHVADSTMSRQRLYCCHLR